ncbi:MAG: polysaccharide biosynthesis/export family protein [Sphingomicrobium sp.]
MKDVRFFRLRGFGLLCLAIAAAAISACTDSRGGSIPYSVSDFGPPDTTAAASVDSNYKIAPMDVLTIRVFGMPDLTGDYEVDLLGNISMPLIGDVAANNLSPAQLDEVLTKKYGAKYLENPDVSVAVKSAAGHIVTVDGAVRRAGSFPVLGSMTLMKAVALAGGANEETANMHRVAIFRTIDGKRQAAAFDLLSIQHGEMVDPPVYSGDIIIVDGSNIKATQKKIFQAVPLLSIFRPF